MQGQLQRLITGWVAGFFILFIPLFAQAFAAEESAVKETEWKDLYEEMVLALLWHQNSDESKALSWQTFNMARDIIDSQLQQNDTSSQKPVLITDIDDTIVDSSSYFAGFLGTNDGLNKERSSTWWQDQPRITRPGALAFLNYAKNKGVELYYLTGRIPTPQIQQSTYQFLKNIGAPVASPVHVKIHSGINKYNFIQDTAKSEHPLLLTIGDKFSDLGVENTNLQKGQHVWLDENPTLPGHRTLVQSNPVGGTWDCLSHNTCQHSATEEARVRKEFLQKWAGNYTPPDNQKSAEDKQIYQAKQMGQSLRWITDSSEYAFITRQIYNRASLPWKEKNHEQSRAVIFDIDGTLLDMTPLSAAIMLNDSGFQSLNLFHSWVRSNKNLRAIPGAVDFIEQVRASGGEVFLVTNRNTHDDEGRDMRPPLLESLALAGFPKFDRQHLIMNGDYCSKYSCSKKVRYEAIRSGKVTGNPVNVIQVFGDNLDDIELTSDDLLISANDEPTPTLSTLGRTRFLLPFPVYTRGWLFRLYKQWHGENWPDTPTETLQDSVMKKIQRWVPGIPMLGK